MLTAKTTAIGFGAWLVAALVAWVALVPRTLSLTTFIWVAGVALVLVAAMLVVARNTGDDRHMSDILYDVEHDDRR